MSDDKTAQIQRILDSFGGVQLGVPEFGRQISAISSAVGTHIAKAVLAMGADPAAEAIDEAAKLMGQQIAEIAHTQVAFVQLGKGNPQ